jgi:tetratricopeptide (TPR) repeat protein
VTWPARLGSGIAALLLLAAAGCAAGPDHEQLGDRRYGEHAYVDALAEYRLAIRQRHPGAELQAKYAEAALRAGALGEAVAGYEALARSEPAALDEAADGLTRAAQLARESRDMSALADAMIALRELAPQRQIGELAVALGAGSTALAKRPDAMDVLLQAAAADTDQASADSFLVAWADANAGLGRCDHAKAAYEGVLRRNPPPGLARQAQSGLAGCAVEQGKLSLSAGALADAEASFRSAIAIGEPDSIVRLAWLLLGDTRWAGGDTLIAVDAYRHAVQGAGDGDPVAARAAAQLQRLLGQGDAAR